ncbi:MAG: hypothetical protein N3D10_03890 [Candidatus Micrarchaeota archaeon]|nr:hypothetical protein [Candidatus Micrarchaeota archaeon]
MENKKEKEDIKNSREYKAAIFYLAGFLKYSKIKRDVGIIDNKNGKKIEMFIKHVLENKIFPPQKIIVRENKAYVKNIKFKTMLKELTEQEVDRLKYHNEYSASFFAGLYDYIGQEKEKYILFKNIDKKDRAVLLNLRFFVRVVGGDTLVGPKDMFIKFIKNYSQKLKAGLTTKKEEQ